MAAAPRSKLLEPKLDPEPRTSSASVTISPATTNKNLKFRGNAEDFLQTYSLGDAFQQHVAYKAVFRIDGANGRQKDNGDKLPGKIVAVSEDLAVADGGGGHLKATKLGDIKRKHLSQKIAPKGLITTIMTAYNQHYNLVISPDEVWLTILAQFSAYVNKNAEGLKGRIVAHEGKKELVAETVGSLTTVDYGDMIKQLLEQIRENIKSPDLADWFRPGFSTTTERDEVCAAATAMGTMQEYFSFKMYLMCGIPSVTLMGTVSDWKLLREKIDRFLEFKVSDKPEGGVMGLWVGYLRKVCDGFVESAEHPGSAKTLEFWDKVVSHHGGGSGPSYITGWVSTFTCFDISGSFIATRSADGSEFPMIDTNDFCHNVVSCPVKINDNGVEYDGTLFTGQVVYEAEQGSDETYPTIRPRNDWCMAVAIK